MPIYEYECGRCGAEFEAIQGMDDPPYETHADYLGDPDVCNGRVARKISASSLRFVGSGFYENDYKKNRARGIGG